MPGSIVFAAAHLGYDTGQVPIGGGAQVGIHLLRRWAVTQPCPITVLGSGPEAPVPGIAYRPIPWEVRGHTGPITDLSVSGYARFCRQFEGGVTAHLARLAHEVEPRAVCVLHNDIAEAGDFARIRKLGFRQAAIFHVDVVDYVARIYLRGRIAAPTLARVLRAVDRPGVRRLVPDVVQLALAKQEACARHCDLLIVPSAEMAVILRRSYPWRTERDVLVLPWGTIADPAPPGVAEVVEEIRAQYRLDDRPVVVALSRISPEKGQDLLLQALARWEREGGDDLVVFICGAPAYMHGGSYMRRLRRLARKLREVEVHFPGYVTGVRKHAFFDVADLYVFPSRHESYGLTLMEALAAGLPVLTTAHRSAPDLVHPEFGRVVAPEPRALCQGLVELLSRREELPAMGAAARRFARLHPFDAAADALAAALVGLLAPSPPVVPAG